LWKRLHGRLNLGLLGSVEVALTSIKGSRQMLCVKVRYDENAFHLTKAYEFDAGWDVHCIEDTHVDSGRWYEVPSGIYIQMPPQMFAELRSRGSCLKKNLVVYNGLIDAGYTGHLSVFAHSLIPNGRWIRRGERIAQLVFYVGKDVEFEEVQEFTPTQRGEKRLGSSG
jgi:dUTP pyrophosphatase